jgi:DNA-binding transcriptional MerR regulator
VEKSPDAFRTISEAAEELGLPQHVLRFWETRFSTIRPLKRGGGRRYYRPEDVLLLKGIRHLLYDQGFTIKGVQRILKDRGPRNVIAVGSGQPLDSVDFSPIAEDELEAEEIEVADEDERQEPRFAALPVPALGNADREQLGEVLKVLLECKRMLDRARDN